MVDHRRVEVGETEHQGLFERTRMFDKLGVEEEGVIRNRRRGKRDRGLTNIKAKPRN